MKKYKQGNKNLQQYLGRNCCLAPGNTKSLRMCW